MGVIFVIQHLVSNRGVDCRYPFFGDPAWGDKKRMSQSSATHFWTSAASIGMLLVMEAFMFVIHFLFCFHIVKLFSFKDVVI